VNPSIVIGDAATLDLFVVVIGEYEVFWWGWHGS
jgi:hypothetical protein